MPLSLSLVDVAESSGSGRERNIRPTAVATTPISPLTVKNREACSNGSSLLRDKEENSTWTGRLLARRKSQLSICAKRSRQSLPFQSFHSDSLSDNFSNRLPFRVRLNPRNDRIRIINIPSRGSFRPADPHENRISQRPPSLPTSVPTVR